MMSLEGIFATLAGVLWLNEIITTIQAFGMVLIFSAIVVSQLSLRFFKELLLKRKQT
jgi:threonine/homoserine efflux transporter RhtA